MSPTSPSVTVDGESSSAAPRSRDADATRALLLDAARRRFAVDGYSSTTVRDIAADAGVNVALINRYFSSKEGLFEECLSYVAVEFDRPDPQQPSLERVVARVVDQVARPDGDKPLQLLLLLRTSGDERADQIRRRTLRGFSESIARLAGWHPGHPDGDALVLRAQIALCTGLGMALLRSSSGLEPLASATAAELEAPLGEVFAALLG